MMRQASTKAQIARNRLRLTSNESGFTLSELLVVVAILALLAATLTPSLAKTKPNGRGIQCLNNLRQVAAAWSFYAADNADKAANNFGVNETLNDISNGKLDNWANNVMTWSASASVTDVSNTNLAWLANGGLGTYLKNDLGTFKCPADKYLSSPQVASGWTARARSISMNSVFGRFSSGSDPTASGMNWAFSQYRQYLKQAEVPRPFKTWLLMDEHPDSINDGYFINNTTATAWQDIPAVFHNGGTGMVFADLHCEMKKWQSSRTRYGQVKYVYPITISFDTLGRQDFAWYLERTGWVSYATGQRFFNY